MAKRPQKVNRSAAWSMLRTLACFSRSVARRAIAAELTGEAAKVAYYFFLSLFPMIIMLFAITGIVGGEAAFDWIMVQLRRTMPGDAATYLEEFVRDVTGESRPGLLSIGILLSLWASSNAFDWLTRTLNLIFDVGEHRPWWKRRLLALAAIITTLVMVTVSSLALLSGPRALERFGFGQHWHVLRWPLVWLLVGATMWLIYYLLPNRRQPIAKRSLLIGAAVGTGLWLLATLGFRAYVAQFGRYSDSYGVVGGVIVLLIWLYLTALAILLGAEVGGDYRGQCALRGPRSFGGTFSEALTRRPHLRLARGLKPRREAPRAVARV